MKFILECGAELFSIHERILAWHVDIIRVKTRRVGGVVEENYNYLMVISGLLNTKHNTLPQFIFMIYNNKQGRLIFNDMRRTWSCNYA